ncbi:hypothetical protein MKX01_041256 [Papaver californicum]|nr:hypothetical protein MKX01_041256 [Papaver californicum]
MMESGHECYGTIGGYIPEGDMGWSQYVGENKELTMWDVVLEMLLVAQGKVKALASGDIHGCTISWLSGHILEQAWKEMAETLTQADFGKIQEILEAVPPKWLPDSSSPSCMLCSVRFHALMCSRHHCRYCGGIFCDECSKGRSLLPIKFRTEDPERVCDVCCVRLESVRSYLLDQVSLAVQFPTHDVTDLSTLRSWVNFPWCQSMEDEIYKASNTILGYSKVGLLKPERLIPRTILRQAKGLAIIYVVKVGVMAGGELTDFIIVLRNSDAVKTFSGNMHFSVGAGLSAAAGIVGREAEAGLRAGDGGYAACYTYSCSKGAFVGCSLNGSIVTTRALENSRFCGSSSISASDILLGSLPRPPAASMLYDTLSDLYQKLDG